MFESSLLPQRRGKDARLVRWIVFGSISAQVVSIAALIVVPLIYPDKLPSLIRPPKLTHVELRRPELKVIPLKPKVVQVTSAAAISAPAHFVQAFVETRRSGMISHSAPVTDVEPALALGGGNVMSSGFNPANGFGTANDSGASSVVVAAKITPASAGPVRVSSGVSRGLLIDPIRPIYPMIAKAAHQQGTVTVTAVI